VIDAEFKLSFFQFNIYVWLIILLAYVLTWFNL